MRSIINKTAAVLLGVLIFATVHAATPEEIIRPIQDQWAEIKYRTPEKLQAEQYEALRADVENTVDVTVTSAMPLTAEQSAKLSAALAARLKRTVRLHAEIDPKLIGGAIVRAGDFVVDGSLRGRVERLGTAVAAQ